MPESDLTSRLARLSGLTRRRIAQLVEDGTLPLTDFDSACAALFTHLRKRADVGESRRKLIEAQIRQGEVKGRRMAGRLLTAEDAKKRAGVIVDAFYNAVNLTGSRVYHGAGALQVNEATARRFAHEIRTEMLAAANTAANVLPELFQPEQGEADFVKIAHRLGVTLD
ncbi:MAG: hypothetical protein IT483_15440 [Gammaproteobacteria bacterium]|nr:hypothetical protein [Gammaproteobacteria bacterium]